MNPIVFMTLKWEKELEQPNRPFIQHQVYGGLLKSKKDERPKTKSPKSTQTHKQCNYVNLVEPQTCNELV